ncbi:MAG: protein kinase [Holophagales bacterium]|nr:protein kinase [Holophagales bacterium]
MNRELGKGAMGVVYLGRDPVIGRLVALKTIRAVSEDDVEQREFQERFLREAQAAGILSHPNIVTVHDVGEDSSTETSFIAMEYVEGKNLKQLLSEKTPYSAERTAEIVGQVGEALDYAHRRGIVHRDVKPANIIITPEGQVKITDFGIAKTEKSNLTTTGQFLGTPNYMSPEQVTGDAVDGRSDLFSLGVVLYELLTRKKPFTADNLTSISYKIVHEQFVPPETYDAGIPPEFTAILGKALSKDPAERFQRGNDFALALYEFKAREEERQMLRDLGQMVAEAEKLGSVAAVTAPPSPLPQPAAPAPPAPSPVVGRSPFDILGSAPAPSAPGAPSRTSSRHARSPGPSPPRPTWPRVTRGRRRGRSRLSAGPRRAGSSTNRPARRRPRPCRLPSRFPRTTWPTSMPRCPAPRWSSPPPCVPAASRSPRSTPSRPRPGSPRTARTVPPRSSSWGDWPGLRPPRAAAIGRRRS